MGSPFVGEIRLFAGNFAPVNWSFCDGSLIPISENEVLFTLLGTTYGGDGVNTFALPDLRGRVPIHQGNLPGGSVYVIGQQGGVESVTLLSQQIPAHTHQVFANSGVGNQSSGQNGFWAQSTLNEFAAPPNSASLAPVAVGNAGGSQPHDNMIPFLTISYIISMFGIFPSQN
jgi:microcystin-dependent protein